MAHKKAGGSTRNGRDSESKRLGVKIYGGQQVLCGNITERQVSTKVQRYANVGLGHKHTHIAKAEVVVLFTIKGPRSRKYVNVVAVA